MPLLLVLYLQSKVVPDNVYKVSSILGFEGALTNRVNPFDIALTACRFKLLARSHKLPNEFTESNPMATSCYNHSYIACLLLYAR